MKRLRSGAKKAAGTTREYLTFTSTLKSHKIAAMFETDSTTNAIRPVECFKEGWQMIKDQYLFFFGVTVVGVYIGNLSLFILTGAMICGIYYCYFRKFDGKPVEFEDLFKGFRYFFPGLLLVLMFIIPVIIVAAGVTIPFLRTLSENPNLTENEFFRLLGGAIVIELILSTLMTCFHTLLLFSFPLMVDRNLTLWQAIKTSAKGVWQNLSGVAGLFVIGFVLSLAGFLVFLIGIYFVLPIIIAGNIVAYRKVFPNTADAANLNKPALNYYHKI